MAKHADNPLNLVFEPAKIGAHSYRPSIARPSMVHCVLCGQDSTYSKHATLPPQMWRVARQVAGRQVQ